MYIHGKYHVHVVLLHVHGIYMVYPWLPMEYHMMYIHGIYTVYPWIFLDIPSFLKPVFSAGPCCWSHSKRTLVLWVIKSTLFHAPPWVLSSMRHLFSGNWARGKGCPQKAQPDCCQPLLLVATVTGWRRWCRRRLSVFLVLSRATTWILVKDGAEAFRAGEQCVEQLTCFPVLKIKREKTSICKGSRSCSSDEPERLD